MEYSVHGKDSSMPIDCEVYFGVNSPAFCQNSYRNHVLTGLPFNNMRNKLNVKKMPLTIPLRPILIIRSDHEANTEDGATSPTKLKKRVMFADEKGNPLTEIKWMSEPSNFPPQWDDNFMAQVTKGASAAPAVSAPSDKWEPAFTQPVSDYVEFRTRVEKNCVSVENVMVKSNEDVTGTIKVKNLAFDKVVFLRLTIDSWKTHQDIHATHVPSLTAGTSVYELFDTFSFNFSIPQKDVKGQSIEFCVCFKCNGCEFWDNNNGVNYKIILIPGKKNEVKKDANMNVFRYEDAFQAKMSNWTEFASWQHLVNSSPYW